MRTPPTEFRIDVGDIELSVLHWPGEGDPVLLLHATGFHSRCWNEVVKALPNGNVYAVDLRFHGASGSIGEVDWQILAADIEVLIERLDLVNLVGVGHSIGGYLIARVAALAPQRFKHLVLIDPVIMSPERYAQFPTSLAGISAADHPVSRRKNAWQDANEMFERFKDREPFSSWQPAVLRDYCDYALQSTDEGHPLKLACDPLNEASIYLTQLGNEVILSDVTRLPMPVTLLRAPSGSSAVTDLSNSPTWPGLANAIPNCVEVYLPQMNHFIPMQDPALTASHIAAALTSQ